MVDAGTFREDLYYRLSTFPIYLPALRERREDIGLLAVALLSRLAPGRALRLAESAHQLLEEQEFAGNVRELRNLMERSSLLCDGDTLESHHIREAINSGRRTSVLGQVSSALTSGTDAKRPPRTSAAPTLKAIERSALIDLASNYTGKRADLAKQLGISERSLYRKLRSAK
jgi:DNA-binding NtrC family response regulator